MSRIVCQFSCGAASAVATKLTLAQYGGTHDVQIINAFIKQEHPDSQRFFAECQAWFGQPIVQLRDEKYGADIIQVFRSVRFIKGPKGAPCSGRLKRGLLDAWKQDDGVIVLGFDASEDDRWQDWLERNPGRLAIAPLITAGLTKDDCKAMVLRAGIALPAMYDLGYDNNNCIGCVKGGEGYWRAIREDFPAHFKEICLVQDELGPGSWFLRYRSGPRKDERFPLRELPEGPIIRNERLPSCSFFCEIAEQEYSA